MKSKIYFISFLVSITCSFTTLAQTSIISTIAGDSAQGFFGDGGPATSAELSYPWGLSVDKLGNIYIADRSNQRIRKVDTNGIISTVAGNGTYGFSGDGGPATSAELNSPWEVAVDTSGNLYIADYDNNRIRKVNAAGIISTIIGGGSSLGDGGPATAAQIYYPASVTLDKYGNIYVADLGDYRIRKVNTAGIISTIAGNGIQSYAGDGGPATAAELTWPNGVTVDTFGNIFIADYGIYRIRKINKSGIISTFAGNGNPGFSGDGGPATAAKVNELGNVHADVSGDVYFADNGSQRIRKVNTTGIISTIAGNGKMGYSGDGGPSTLAQLNQPQDVTTDVSGSIYIADYGNGRIRKLLSSILSINELATSLDVVKLYPNPSTGLFTFESSSTNTGTRIEIYNILGEKVYNEALRQAQGDNTINLSGQPSGIYLYRILTENGSLIDQGKLIKE